MKEAEWNPNWKGGISSIKVDRQLLQFPPEVLDRVRIRFLKHVHKAEDCWLWTASKFNGRYGRFTLGQSFCAHRISYILFVGDPGDLWVLHTCDIMPCVNPEHLFLGTPRENTQDMITKGRKFLTLGSTNGQAKLCDADVIQIRERYRNGELQKHLAKEFRVSKANISLIVRGKAWFHI